MTMPAPPFMASFKLLSRLRPLTLIGGDALKAFIFHIVVIFGVFRYLLEAWQVYSYPQVLGIGVALVLATAGWIALTGWLREKRG